MSGPKVNEYELSDDRFYEEMRLMEEARIEAERRRQVEAQRREEERRREEEQRRKACVGRIESMLEALGEWQSELTTIKGHADYMNKDGDSSSLESILSGINAGMGPYNKNSLEAALRKEEKLNKLMDGLQEKVEAFKAKDAKWEKQESERLDQAFDSLFKAERTKRTSKSSGNPPGSSENSADKDGAKKQELKLRAEELLVQVEELLAQVDAGSEIAMHLQHEQEVMNNQYQAEDYRGILDYYSLNGRKRSDLLSAYRTRKEAFHTEFTNTRVAYESVCELAGMEFRTFQDKDETPDNCKWMQDETARVKELLMRQRERQIVKQEIESVMEELGYTVIAAKDTTRKSGSAIHERVYSYNEGTAINITEVNGQFTMEVVGVDTSDREPSESEADYLEEEMETFCEVHRQVEELLRPRGVVLKNRIRMNKPSREYAQILNINDYEQKKEHISMIQSIERKTGKKAAGQMQQKNLRE